MSKDKFSVCFNGELLARDLDLDVSMILAKALFDHYYLEIRAEVTIVRQHESKEEEE